MASQEAAEAARDGSLAGVEARDDAAHAAQGALARLVYAEKVKPVAKVDGMRAVTLRSRWRVELSDEREAAAWGWRDLRPELVEWLTVQAQAKVNRGARDVPGFAVTEERVAA